MRSLPHCTFLAAFQKTIGFTGGVVFANQPQFETLAGTRRRCPCESTGILRGAGEGPASAAHSSQRQVTLKASANHRHSWTVARCC
jgi:hypothetical protein